ncbi:MAG: terminase family protein [Hyphomonadaceae bacterium]|nr:terminase family protein [Hyphomonadaceae bacterium]
MFWSRPAQRAPEGDWRTWLFLGGRGAGKTRAGAEWTSFIARTGLARRIALIAPTFHDVRAVMVEGESGLLALPQERPVFEPSRRRLIWRSGAIAQCFSAEDPEALRGPQFDAAWCDELCYWSKPDEALATLAHAMRLGEAPRKLVTTTPRPLPALKRLIAAPGSVVTRSGTMENSANLAPGFIAALRETWTGSVRERQELLGELIEDVEGALWTRASIEAARAMEPGGPLDRVVVAIDPPVGLGAGVDACGIVAAGAYGSGLQRRAVVLADASVQGLAPQDWAERAADLARSIGAREILAEANNGGELVRVVLKLAAPDIPIRLVRAKVDKRQRAGPAAMFYAQGRVAHRGRFAELEDQMCSFGAPGFSGSPDRLDALVWALTELLDGGEGPRVRTI